MRLFVALVPPPEAVAELRRAVDPIRSRYDGLRWTGPQGWHLTLAFLGTVEPKTRIELETRLARVAARHPPRNLALTGSGRFGDRTLWIGIRGDRRAMAALAVAVRRAAGKCHIPIEGRPWHGHVTLARVAQARGAGGRRPPGSALTDPAADLAGFDGVEWTAARLHLVQSVIGNGPARYHDVATWPLVGRRSSHVRAGGLLRIVIVTADDEQLVREGDRDTGPSARSRSLNPAAPAATAAVGAPSAPRRAHRCRPERGDHRRSRMTARPARAVAEKTSTKVNVTIPV
ncbi:RNA 2',3'-cyclic phosphodiesterase [Embleya sp. NPDC050154]|uniref:RNA 2',3'-cyclic phosphodiesterase n=1 Tax=Embleya sp. NPDC050154 TaxID=3363988 RepID=UPI0037B6F24A